MTEHQECAKLLSYEVLLSTLHYINGDTVGIKIKEKESGTNGPKTTPQVINKVQDNNGFCHIIFTVCGHPPAQFKIGHSKVSAISLEIAILSLLCTGYLGEPGPIYYSAMTIVEGQAPQVNESWPFIITHNK